MSVIEAIASFLGVKKAAFVIGFIGAVVSLKFVKRAESWFEKAFMVFGGAVAAGYLEPPISAYFNVTNGGFIAFIIGLFGMSLAAAIMDVIDSTKWGKLVTEFIRKRLGLGV